MALDLACEIQPIKIQFFRQICWRLISHMKCGLQILNKLKIKIIRFDQDFLKVYLSDNHFINLRCINSILVIAYHPGKPTHFQTIIEIDEF